jgi:uncharacterized protein (TIGR03663 family)
MPPAVSEQQRRWAAVAAVTTISAILHFWDLGRRPLHHDESIDAWFSWQARNGGVMRYDPVYHGPLRFYLEGIVLRIFGTGAYQARIVAATAGVATSALIAGSTRTLGRVGAPVAGLAFTISPTILTVTRTGREDSLVGLVSVGLLLVVARILIAPRSVHLVVAGGLLAVSFGLKETTFIFGFAAFVFVVGFGVVAWRWPNGGCRAAVRRLAAFDRVPWMWASIVFVVTFIVIFTSGFRYPEGFESGLLDGLRYWWSQQDVARGSQRAFFYTVIYAAYEWLLLALAIAGAIVTVRRRSLIGAWFLTMAVVQFALYTWASERFAWLALHPLLPTVLLGGLGAEAISKRIAEWSPPRLAAAGVGAAVAVALTIVVGARPAITDGADPRELLVTVQTSQDVPAVADQLRDGSRDGTIDSIVIDSTGGGSWPWVSYLHGLDNVGYLAVDQESLPDADAIVVLAGAEAPAIPEGYTAQRFRLREWWLPDYDNASIGDAVRWLLTREPWSPTGSTDQYLIMRE